MTLVIWALIWALSALLIAELVMAPIKLWTGRTMPAVIRFTGHAPLTARGAFAPVKLSAAILVATGRTVPAAGVAGAALASAVSAVCLGRLAAHGRRDPAGIAVSSLFGGSGAALRSRRRSRRRGTALFTLHRARRG